MARTAVLTLALSAVAVAAYLGYRTLLPDGGSGSGRRHRRGAARRAEPARRGPAAVRAPGPRRRPALHPQLAGRRAGHQFLGDVVRALPQGDSAAQGVSGSPTRMSPCRWWASRSTSSNRCRTSPKRWRSTTPSWWARPTRSTLRRRSAWISSRCRSPCSPTPEGRLLGTHIGEIHTEHLDQLSGVLADLRTGATDVATARTLLGGLE